MMAAENFWNNQEQAQKFIDEGGVIRRKIDPLVQYEKQLEDLKVLLELGEAEPMDRQAVVLKELEREATPFVTQVERLELDILLSGPHDRKNCILSINAGAGGTEDDPAFFPSSLSYAPQTWTKSTCFSIGFPSPQASG